MSTKKFLSVALLVVLVPLIGCAKAVGDECTSNVECPSGAICDVTVEAGYCTIPNCEYDNCPDGSVCIQFDREQSFCMQYCESGDDCRDGYVCRDDMEGPNFCYVPAEEPTE